MNELFETIKLMPKIELHVHLEGSVEPELLLSLAKKNNIELPASSLSEIKEWYKYEDFTHFLQIYFKICECIKTKEDVELIAKEFLTKQAKQNIIYSEVTYTPYTHFEQHRLSIEDQTNALIDAKKWAEEHLGITCKFIYDISRNVTPEEGTITANWVKNSDPNAIIALGLGGPEKEFPPKIHKGAFDIITEAGIASIPHAGEVAGPKSIWDSIYLLKADRIGHGVRAIEDDELINYLIENNITIDVCPTSNICLGVYNDISEHPLPELVKKGVKVTINSDDPPMFNTTLTNEYLTIVKAFNYTMNDLYNFNLNALNAAILSNKEKDELTQKFDAEWAKLQHVHIDNF